MQLRTKSKEVDHNFSEPEKVLKEQLEPWIVDAKKKAELEQRLQKVFENNIKTHAQFFSEL